jgi:hypothetical protein
MSVQLDPDQLDPDQLDPDQLDQLDPHRLDPDRLGPTFSLEPRSHRGRWIAAAAVAAVATVGVLITAGWPDDAASTGQIDHDGVGALTAQQRVQDAIHQAITERNADVLTAAAPNVMTAQQLVDDAIDQATGPRATTDPTPTGVMTAQQLVDDAIDQAITDR